MAIEDQVRQMADSVRLVMTETYLRGRQQACRHDMLVDIRWMRPDGMVQQESRCLDCGEVHHFCYGWACTDVPRSMPPGVYEGYRDAAGPIPYLSRIAGPAIWCYRAAEPRTVGMWV